MGTSCSGLAGAGSNQNCLPAGELKVSKRAAGQAVDRVRAAEREARLFGYHLH